MENQDFLVPLEDLDEPSDAENATAAEEAIVHAQAMDMIPI